MLSLNVRQLSRICSVIPWHAAASSQAHYVTSENDDFRLRQFTEKYLHGRKAVFTEKLEFSCPNELPTIPIYRVTDTKGRIMDSTQDPHLDKETSLRMYHLMVLMNNTDKILYDSQRQGRISFYMTNFGEEACHLGCAASLKEDDLIYAQYRELGVLLWRGFTIEDIVSQCYGNSNDLGKGKQMPVHYGSADLNFVTISSPLATQVPQAVGSAYAFKRANNGRVVICFLGDGSASEGDTHAAFNASSTLKCPIIFFVRNNGYAISTPTSEQYGGDGVAGRGLAYGIRTVRVDGNDVLACYNAVKEARKIASENKPCLIEAMTYRVSHHSTSDDSTAYRSSEEVETWNTVENPLTRFREYLKQNGWWNEAEEVTLAKEYRKRVMKTFLAGEKVKMLHPLELFNDVYKEMPMHIRSQKEQLSQHLKEYGHNYPLDRYEKTPRN
uniref:2-oxoisovalerate dehydrogenase subunit alpha n=1 Tax=Syphacia muris TaxID=451379 RepID=A0A0N5AU77_9BILA